MIKRAAFAGLLILWNFAGTYGTDESKGTPLRVSEFYPVGTDVAVDEPIEIDFNQDVVTSLSSGYTDDEIPIDIEPTLPCKWEWVKTDRLRCSLPHSTTLDPSTRYVITINSGLVTRSGHTLKDDYVHVFDTVVPTIKRARLHSWISRDRPIVDVSFDQNIELSSLKDRVFMYDVVTEREIPTTVLPYTWELRQALLTDYFGRQQRYQNYAGHHGLGDDEYKEGDRVFVVPSEPLSPNVEISVVLLPGVKGAQGELKTTERRLADTFIEFSEDFRFLGLLCYDSNEMSHFLEAGKSHDETCNVDLEISLVFSSSVENHEINEIVHTLPQTAREDRFLLIDNEYYRSGTRGVKYRIRTEFEPGTTYQLFIASTDDPNDTTSVKDGFGQPIVGPTEVTFKTADSPALILLAQPSITVNSSGQFEPLVYLQNIDELSINYRIIDEQGATLNQSRPLPGPTQNNVLEPQTIDLRSTLRTPSGLMFGELVGQSRIEPTDEQLQQHFFVQVTPYSVFFKLGEASSLTWVVNTETGRPVANADVDLYVGTPNDFSDTNEIIFSGTTDSDGLISLPGYEAFDPNGDRFQNVSIQDCIEDRDCSGYFLRVRGESGLALLPLYEDFILSGWGQIDSIYYKVKHWITTSQKLYRPGDTVHIKGYFRNQREKVQFMPSDYHFGLCIEQSFLKKIEIAPIYLNQFGAYHTSFKLSKYAQSGSYRVNLIYDLNKPVTNPCSHTQSYTYGSKATSTPGVFVTSGGSFEVNDYRTNPIHVSLDFDAQTYYRGDNMTITTSSKLRSGEIHANALGYLMINLYPREPPLELDIEGEWLYEFSGRDFVTDSYWGFRDSRIKRAFELDQKGENTLTIDALDNNIYYGKFVIEGSVFSDYGKSVNTYAIASYYGVDQFVGIQKPQSWRLDLREGQIRVGEAWPIQTIVVSKDSQVVSGKKVQISIHQFDPEEGSWVEVHRCELDSKKKPVSCDLTPTDETSYRIDANIVDSNGNPHRSTIKVEAVVDVPSPPGQPKFVKRVPLNLICNEQPVEVGSTIRCKVEDYLDPAQTLVTIERAGIIDQWLTLIDPTDPEIEFTVREEYAPHFKLSVLSVSPRPTKVNPNNALFGVGTQQFKLESPRDVPLKVSVSSNLQSYQPAGRVSLTLTADEQTDGTTPIEYAVVIVDGRLIDYISRKDRGWQVSQSRLWDEFRTNRRPKGETIFDPTIVSFGPSTHNSVRTFGLIDTLIETSVVPVPPKPRFFEDEFEYVISSHSSRYPPFLVPPYSTAVFFGPEIRSGDSFIAYWNPSIVTSNGTSKLDLVLPDSNANWRVMVLAASADGRFGFATTSFNAQAHAHVKVDAPSVVTEGDKFQVVASIHNRADVNRTLYVDLKASGVIAKKFKTSLRKRLRIAPTEKKSVSFDLQAGRLQNENFQKNDVSVVQIRATVSDGEHTDVIDTTIPVRSMRDLVSRVVQGKIEDTVTFVPINIPKTQRDDLGWLDVAISTNEAINFEGIFRFASEIETSSWEQYLSKAILAMHYLDINKSGIKQKFVWLEAEQIINDLLDSANDFQRWDGGMSHFAHHFSRSDPYVSAYSALAFFWLSRAGYEIPEDVSKKLLTYLRKFLIEKLQPALPITDKSVKDIRTITGAVTVHALSLWEKISETELVNFSKHIDRLDLFGLSHYLLALLSQNASEQTIAHVYEQILTQRVIDDGGVRFEDSVLPRFSQILHTDTRSRCSLLKSLSNLAENTSIGSETSDLHTLVNAVVSSRGYSAHWLNTQENVFCMNAIIEYSDLKDLNIGDLTVSVDLNNTGTDESTRLVEAWRFDTGNTLLNYRQQLRKEIFRSRGGVEIRRLGEGSAFYNVEYFYQRSADEPSDRLSTFEIHREYVVLRDKKWQILKPNDRLHKGEIVLVTLFLNNSVIRSYVEINDPVPGGLKPVEHSNWSDELFNETPDSEYLLRNSRWYDEFKDASNGWQSQYEIRGPKSVRYFAKELKPIKYYVSWTGQTISTGEFTVPPTRVKEMYRPSVFGTSEPRTLRVNPK